MSEPSNASLKLFVNGSLALDSLVGTGSAPGSVYFTGAGYPAANALLGDFGLWNTALSDAQVAALTSPPAAVPEPATWLMALGGLFAVATAVRRRRPYNGRWLAWAR